MSDFMQNGEFSSVVPWSSQGDFFVSVVHVPYVAVVAIEGVTGVKFPLIPLHQFPVGGRNFTQGTSDVLLFFAHFGLHEFSESHVRIYLAKQKFLIYNTGASKGHSVDLKADVAAYDSAGP